MGSENWLMFKSPKEAERAMDYLAPLDGFLGIEDKWGCWIEYKHRSTKSLQIGVNAGSSTSGIHDFVRRELCHRFDVRRIGHSCVGWYSDPIFKEGEGRLPNARYHGYTSWVPWAKDYKVEWSCSLPVLKYYPVGYPQADFDAEYKFYMDELLEVEAYVVGVFADLDKQHKDSQEAQRE